MERRKDPARAKDPNRPRRSQDGGGRARPKDGGGRARPKDARRKPEASPGTDFSALPDDDRFAPHPGQSIDTVYVIARAVDLVGARPREVLGVMLLGLVVSTVLLFPVVSFDVFGSAGIEDPTHPAKLTALSVLAWACALLLQAPLVGSAIEVHTTRRGLFLEFLRRGSTQLPSLMVASLGALVVTIVTMALAGALVAGLIMITAPIPWVFVALIVRVVGTVAISIVALRVITSFGLVVPVVVMERLGPGAALRRAWTLGWPNSFPILMALVLPLLLAQALLFITGFLPTIVMIVTAIVLWVALSVYQSVVVPVAYVAIREYVDGVDPASLLARYR